MEKSWLTNNSPTKLLRRIFPLKQSRPEFVRARVAQTSSSKRATVSVQSVLTPECSIQTSERDLSRRLFPLSGRELLGLLQPGTDDATAKTHVAKGVSLVVQDPRSHVKHLLGHAGETLIFTVGKGTDLY